MSKQIFRSTLAAVALLGAGVAVAPPPVAAAQAAIKDARVRTNVYQYAVDNPVDNSTLRSAPSLGASVPQTVMLVPCKDEKTYAYFYYNDRPVIVDMTTRSVVRFDRPEKKK